MDLLCTQKTWMTERLLNYWMFIGNYYILKLTNIILLYKLILEQNNSDRGLNKTEARDSPIRIKGNGQKVGNKTVDLNFRIQFHINFDEFQISPICFLRIFELIFNFSIQILEFSSA